MLYLASPGPPAITVATHCGSSTGVMSSLWSPSIDYSATAAAAAAESVLEAAWTTTTQP